MDEKRTDEERIDPELTEWLRDAYNVAPPAPGEAMWETIRPGLTPRGATVYSLGEARARRAERSRPLGWVAAAAAVLVLGIGIGRMSAPAVRPLASADEGPDAGLLRAAALDHLGRTESLLTLVRADARSGRIDPAMGEWARGLLSQTRLLLDSPDPEDPAMRDLLEDLELVLVQIVGVTEHGGDAIRIRSEMSLALQGLAERDVLPRIQAVMPVGPGLAGT